LRRSGFPNRAGPGPGDHEADLLHQGLRHYLRKPGVHKCPHRAQLTNSETYARGSPQPVLTARFIWPCQLPDVLESSKTRLCETRPIPRLAPDITPQKIIRLLCSSSFFFYTWTPNVAGHEHCINAIAGGRRSSVV
jgi:hypothetical protein